MRIDDDAAAIVVLNAGSFETEPFGVRHAADRDQDHVGLDRLGGAAVDRLDLHLERLSGRVDAGDLRRQFESDALALLDALKLARDLAVEAGQNVIEKLDDGDLGAEAAPHRAELHADDAGTDHEQLLRHLGQIERAGRGHDAFLVDVDAGKPRHIRAGGDDDVFGLKRLGLAVGRLDLDLAGRGDAACTVKGLDLVLLEQKIDALDVALDVALLVFEQRRKIDAQLIDLDAHLREAVSGLLVQLGGMQHRLRRDAADIETRAAERGALLHHGGLQPKLCRANGAHIAAGAGTDDDEVVGHNAITSASSCPRPSRASTPFFIAKARRGWPGHARP